MVSSDVRICLLLYCAMAWLCVAEVPLQIKNDSACYGTFNSYLNLVCGPGETLRITRAVYGAKPVALGCKAFSTQDAPQPECCEPAPGDCMIEQRPVGLFSCELRETCNVRTDWLNTYTHCDQEKFPITSNYMSINYTCRGEKHEGSMLGRVMVRPPAPDLQNPPPPDERGQQPPDHVVTEPEPRGDLDITTPLTLALPVDTDGRDNTTYAVILSSKPSGHHSGDELSDSMVAAVVGGSIGMCLTLVLFIFYWGRKKRLRIVSNKQPTVWDYLLTNTFTVRGYNGYDHFSSKRSSASSEGDSGSPVIRKNMWLPNIVQETEDPQDDVISNYDNTRYKVPKVEVHPGASPSPYAILNLETLHNHRQRDNHEA